ncbi:MAG: DUF547 domain-containing protein [Rhodothalassiaceae bacterium]
MRIWLVPLVLLLGACTTVERLYLPSAKVQDTHWQQATAGTGAVDHGAWAVFLDRYVRQSPDGVHLVDYGAVTPADETALLGYLERLQAVKVTDLPRMEQLAFWINLYNAVTVRTVLEAYPVDSIRDISLGGVLSVGPWGEDLVTVEDRALSLNDIEHKIVRPVFQDPRIHYALNCAAYQCPNLRAEPYRGAVLDAQLNAQARAYVNDPRGVTVKPDGDLVLSKIYVWFKEDFGGSEAVVLEHLSQYAEGPLFDTLTADPDIDDYVYDWSLNDAARLAAPGS